MKQLDPKAVWVFFVSYLLRWLVPGVILLIYGTGVFVGMEEELGEYGSPLAGRGGSIAVGMGGFAVLFLGFLYFWARLSYRFYKYELTENGFRKELGVIYKKYTTIPYERIQNVDIQRGILARILGLSDLHIQTAGMSQPMGKYGGGFASEGRLPALAKDDADRVRDELIRRAQGHSSGV